jgi:chromosome segregation ATPase
MSSEFESVKSEIQELKEAVKALTKTVTENMVKQGEKLGVLQQWKTEVDKKLDKSDQEITNLKDELNSLKSTNSAIISKQNTCFTRIDEIKKANESDDKRLDKIESNQDRLKGVLQTISVIGSIVSLGLGYLAIT